MRFFFFFFMLHSTGYSALNGPISHRDAHKTCIFLKTPISKKCTLFFFSHICTEFSLTIQNSIPKVTLVGLDFLQIKSPFYNKGDFGIVVFFFFFFFFTLIVSSINILSMF